VPEVLVQKPNLEHGGSVLATPKIKVLSCYLQHPASTPYCLVCWAAPRRPLATLFTLRTASQLASARFSAQ
uniref:Uncharacterized protein n=1 Tax=Aegilops tauschii subsp. strangulata TaxID=200361 RepID=A0A453RP48_AEGTS